MVIGVNCKKGKMGEDDIKKVAGPEWINVAKGREIFRRGLYRKASCL